MSNMSKVDPNRLSTNQLYINAATQGSTPKAMPVNPKALYGDAKLPLYLVPFSFVAHVSLALYDGMRKYGLVNWRASHVLASTYVSAAERHIKAWNNGQKCDPVSKVHHLAHAAACCCILLDAEANKSLIDDRPLPNTGMADLIAELEGTLDHLRKAHADRESPKHWTIADMPVDEQAKEQSHVG